MKLKCFCTTWHVFHYNDLFNALADHVDFYLCHNNHRSWKDPRFCEARPIPDNAHFVPHFEKGKYDFALLNVDQQVTNLDLGKSKLVRELANEVRKDEIPLVFINHATPVYPEFWKRTIIDEESGKEVPMTDKQSEAEVKRRIRDIVEDDLMIVNSYEAVNEWGWGHPIWHGMNTEEWLDLPKEPRIFTALSAGGCDEYYNRACMNEVDRILQEEYGYNLFWAKSNTKIKDFKDYKEWLGRSLIYLDTSIRTPMNRARTEAMLSGSCVVQVEGAHDLEMFAKDGQNMIIVPDHPKEIAKVCVDLIENDYKKAIKIGQAGKETAKKTFNRARFRDDWLSFLKTNLQL